MTLLYDFIGETNILVNREIQISNVWSQGLFFLARKTKRGNVCIHFILLFNLFINDLIIAMLSSDEK